MAGDILNTKFVADEKKFTTEGNDIKRHPLWPKSEWLELNCGNMTPNTMSWIRTRLYLGIDSLELQQEQDTTRNISAEEDKGERNREIKTWRDAASAELVGLLVLTATVSFRPTRTQPEVG